MKNVRAFWITCLAVLSTCAVAADEWIRLVHPELNSQFVAQLQSQGIAARLVDDGKIFYPASKQAAVTWLAKEFISNDLPSQRSISFSNPSTSHAFTTKLQELGVPYVVKQRHGAQWVVWESGHEEAVASARAAGEAEAEKQREAWLNGRGKL